jgi:hypothetical protein
MAPATSRKDLFRRLRRDRCRDEAERMTPEERYARAAALITLARALAPGRGTRGLREHDPAELWLSLQRRFRDAAGRT